MLRLLINISPFPPFVNIRIILEISVKLLKILHFRNCTKKRTITNMVLFLKIYFTILTKNSDFSHKFIFKDKFLSIFPTVRTCRYRCVGTVGYRSHNLAERLFTHITCCIESGHLCGAILTCQYISALIAGS